MGYALRMSAEIRDWLSGLSDADPATATAVGQALIALASAGPELGPPAVVAVGSGAAGADPREQLDYAYQERLDRLQVVRAATADAEDLGVRIREQIAELTGSGSAGKAEELSQLLPGLRRAEARLAAAGRRMQADADAFRLRMQTLKAMYAAALAQESLAGAFGAAARQHEDEQLAAQGRRSGAAAAGGLEQAAAAIAQELGGEAEPARLMELRPGAPGTPGGGVRVIFAVQPPGTALLISVLEGTEAIAEHRGQAIALSADIVRRISAGTDRLAAAAGFADGEQLAAELFPDSYPDVLAGAAALAELAGPRSLAGQRSRRGLSQEQVAARMGVPGARVAAIETGYPAQASVGALAGYVEALGGRLDVTADLGDVRIALR